MEIVQKATQEARLPLQNPAVEPDDFYFQTSCNARLFPHNATVRVSRAFSRNAPKFLVQC